MSVSPPPSPTDLFISYPWGKKAPDGTYPLQALVLKRVVAPLTAAGYSCWVDIERMPGAAVGAGDLPEAMTSGISASSAIIICVCAEYAASGNCKTEAKYAKRAKKPMIFANVGQPPDASGNGG